jgi:adenylate cyclase
MEMRNTPPGDTEIERKYLLRGLPPRAAATAGYLVVQGWLPGQRIRERLRRVRADGREQYFRTVKLGSGLVRTEVEETISRRLFRRLWPLTEGTRIRKRRHLVPAGRLTWEIDDFLDFDLVLAEVELPSPEAEVTLPEWLAPWVVAEVTGRVEYTNLHMARHGPPPGP